jgi:corrinoid protein of di/trimethylamine methyltransferase
MAALFEQMKAAIIDGDPEKATALARTSLDQDMSPLEALEKGFSPGMSVLGDRFEKGEVFLTELLLAEEAMNAAVEVLKPKIAELKSQTQTKGKVVIGVIQGDVHDIGKNIIKLFLSVSGYEVIDLGRDVPVRQFIETAQKENADIIAASALMTTTMIYMPELIKQLGERGIRDQFKVMVGGAPVVRSCAAEIGSDGYGRTTREAIAEADRLVE